MRIDKFLKVSRLIKRRTVANEACDAGRVSINGRTVKAGAEVKARGHGLRRLRRAHAHRRGAQRDEHASKSDAPAMYRQI